MRDDQFWQRQHRDLSSRPAEFGGVPAIMTAVLIARANHRRSVGKRRVR